jgi:hypothetical protein
MTLTSMSALRGTVRCELYQVADCRQRQRLSVANGGCSNGIHPCNPAIGSWSDPTKNTHNAPARSRRATIGRWRCPICNVGTSHLPRLRLPKGAPFLEAIQSLCVRAALRLRPRSSVHGACSYPAAAARPGRGRFSAARWELAMLRIIQANDLALSLNVLAVCAVFVFVGALLLGAF